MCIFWQKIHFIATIRYFKIINGTTSDRFHALLWKIYTLHWSIISINLLPFSKLAHTGWYFKNGFYFCCCFFFVKELYCFFLILIRKHIDNGLCTFKWPLSLNEHHLCGDGFWLMCVTRCSKMYQNNFDTVKRYILSVSAYKQMAYPKGGVRYIDDVINGVPR